MCRKLGKKKKASIDLGFDYYVINPKSYSDNLHNARLGNIDKWGWCNTFNKINPANRKWWDKTDRYMSRVEDV